MMRRWPVQRLDPRRISRWPSAGRDDRARTPSRDARALSLRVRRHRVRPLGHLRDEPLARSAPAGAARRSGRDGRRHVPERAPLPRGARARGRALHALLQGRDPRLDRSRRRPGARRSCPARAGAARGAEHRAGAAARAEDRRREPAAEETAATEGGGSAHAVELRSPPCAASIGHRRSQHTLRSRHSPGPDAGEIEPGMA